MTSNISFPGIGLGPFRVSPIAASFSSLPITIRWYGVIIAAGMIVGILYVLWMAKRRKSIPVDDLLDCILAAIPVGIICARLYYVLFNLGEYHSFYDVVAVWNGGLAIYGGVIGGLIAIFIVTRVKRISFAAVIDRLAPAVMIGQIFGRWGNFFNAEAYGTLDRIGFPLIGDIPTPSLPEHFPLRMVIENDFVGTIAVHPTFLYESVWNLCGLILIHLRSGRKKFEGETALTYLVWYGFGRFFIEGLREDSLMLGSQRISQLVAAAFVIIGGILLILGTRRANRKNLALDGYVSQFGADTSSDEPPVRTEASESEEEAGETKEIKTETSTEKTTEEEKGNGDSD